MQNYSATKREYNKFNQKAGDVFGRLTLTGKHHTEKFAGGFKRVVEAICECGVIREYEFDLLKRGKTKSCGCWKSDELKQNPHAKTHGYTSHPLYTVYLGMKERCYRESAINYADYGGRGICICKEWLESPKAFIEWALKNGWQFGLDIDRRENDGNYEPDNCRFVTPTVGSRNRRNNRMITAFGQTKCLMEWAEDPRCKVNFKRLWVRLTESSWNSIEEMITTPPKKRGLNISNRADNRMVFAFGEEKSISEWLKDERCVADEKRLRRRLWKGINFGWSAEKALTTKIRKLPTPVI